MKSLFPLKGFIAGVALIALCAGVFIYNFQPHEPQLWVELLAALFAGFASVAMFCALTMQSQELSLQRKELSETRKVLTETSAANKKSATMAERNLKAQYLFTLLEQRGKHQSLLNKDTELYREISELQKKLTLCSDFLENPTQNEKHLRNYLTERAGVLTFAVANMVSVEINSIDKKTLCYIQEQIKKLENEREPYKEILKDFEKYFKELDELTTSIKANSQE